jgi:hypothetical protein
LPSHEGAASVRSIRIEELRSGFGEGETAVQPGTIPLAPSMPMPQNPVVTTLRPSMSYAACLFSVGPFHHLKLR